MKLRWNTITGNKTFYIYGRFQEKIFHHKCGTYIKGKTGIAEIEHYILKLFQNSKDRDGKWVSNPNVETVRKSQLKRNNKYTIIFI